MTGEVVIAAACTNAVVIAACAGMIVGFLFGVLLRKPPSTGDLPSPGGPPGPHAGVVVMPRLNPPLPRCPPAGMPPSPAHQLMIDQARLARAQAEWLELDNAKRRDEGGRA